MANKAPVPRKKTKDWTEKQKKELIALYPTLSNSEIAARLKRSVKSIRAKAVKLNIKKKNWKWTELEETYVLEKHNVESYEDTAKKLNRTRVAVINKYRELVGKREK